MNFFDHIHILELFAIFTNLDYCIHQTKNLQTEYHVKINLLGANHMDKLNKDQDLQVTYNLGNSISRRQLIFGGGTLALGSLLIAACGGKSDEGVNSDGAEPEKPSKIIMRSWGEPYSTSIEKFAAVAFTAATGIKVEFDLTDFMEMRVKVEEAYKAGTRPPVDVLYTTTSEAFVASQQGYAMSLNSASMSNYAKLTAAGIADDGTTNWVNLYTYTLPLLYRKDLVTFPEAFKWDELWDPKYKGKIGINLDPNVLVWSLSKVLGLDPATDDLTKVWDRCRELKSNIKAIYTSDTEMITMLNSGEIEIAFSLPGNILAIENEHGALAVPEEGVMLASDGVYIPAGTPENVKYWAEVFINELIGASAQTDFNQAIGAVPVSSEAKAADYMLGQPAYPFTDEELAKYAIPVQNAVYAKFKDDWIEKFTIAFQG